MREFVIGDIHGAHRALKQCLERAFFDYENDKLICLGDVADGWTEVAECFTELQKIKNLVYIRGNHDQWLKQWLHKGDTPNVWTMQGGQNTILSYMKNLDARGRDLDFLKKSKFYYIDENNRAFMHGGFDPSRDMDKQDKQYLMWDRSFWENRGKWKDRSVGGFNEVYVGHTSIYHQGHHEPKNFGNIWFMDTGGGWEGVLSMMDINTKETFQSDKVSGLYPEVKGRN